MMKKALAALLALILLFCAVPLGFASDGGDDWLLYYENTGANTFNAIFVAPAAYTRVSAAPQIEAAYTEDPAGGSVSAPAAEQIRFYSGGKTETRWALTAACTAAQGTVPGYNMLFAVAPGSVTDEAGRGNPRVRFEDGTEYRPAGGFTEIDVASGLLLRDYARTDDTVAVGDTLRVEYSGFYPVEIFVNGEKAAAFPGGEMQSFLYSIAETGMLSVTVRQNGEEIAARTAAVITSAEMYERNLRDGLITGEDIPGTAELVDVGLPAGSLFIPLAKIISFFVLLREFFFRLFSLSRVTN